MSVTDVTVSDLPGAESATRQAFHLMTEDRVLHVTVPDTKVLVIIAAEPAERLVKSAEEKVRTFARIVMAIPNRSRTPA